MEGFNNKAKVVTKRSYGFRTYEGLKIALYHALGDLPTPKTTHRFCGRGGFLIESPEPIEWRKGNEGRVSLQIERSSTTQVASGLAYGPVKLIDCNLDGDEWAEVLARVDLDLSGYMIERVAEDASSALRKTHRPSCSMSFPQGPERAQEHSYVPTTGDARRLREQMPIESTSTPNRAGRF